MSSSRIAVWCLLTITICLLIVGLISNTFTRHVIQVLPLVVAAAMMNRLKDHALVAALALLIFWSMIMVLIWLYLLGITTVFSGRFTITEIVLTIIMGVTAFYGIARILTMGFYLRWYQVVLAFSAGFIVQYVVLMVSFGGAVWINTLLGVQ